MFLAAIFLVVVAYTAVVIGKHGWNFAPVFFGDIAALSWRGQFNMDFTGFLLLSGLWVAWRHEFSAVGLLLAVVAILGGIVFLSAYLLVASRSAGNDTKVLLLGARRASH